MTAPASEERDARRRAVLVALVVGVSVLLVGAGIALAVMARRPQGVRPATPVGSSDTSQTATSGTVTPAGETTHSSQAATATTATVASAGSGSAHPGTVVRSSKIAFRLGGQIFVADEDGGHAKPVYRSADAAFDLAPDASTLAVGRPSGGGSAVLVNVASGHAVPVVNAVDLPVWAGDSSWAAYTSRDASGTYSVRRISRDGTGDALLVKPGGSPQVSPDGRQVAFVRTNQSANEDALAVLSVPSKTVTRLPSLSGRPIARAAGSLDYAWSPSGTLFFAQAGGTTGSGYVGQVGTSLTGVSQLVSLPATTPALAPDDLAFTPNGSQIVLTENGDDGYSRMVVVEVAKKTARQLPTRRDAYPLRWSADGTSILYIEGNAIQMENTALYTINPDGTRRVLLVAGAGL